MDNKRLCIVFATCCTIAFGWLQFHSTDIEDASESRWPKFVNGKRVFPNISLTTHEGEKVLFYDDLVKDQLVFVYFMYTECEGTCLPTTNNLKKVQRLLEANVSVDFRIVAVSLTPTSDTPEVLANYAEALGVTGNWQFVTGDEADIEDLRRNMGFYDLDPVIDADKSQHGAIVAYGNDRTGRWGAIPSLLAPERILSAALLTLTDFSEGRVSHSGKKQRDSESEDPA